MTIPATYTPIEYTVIGPGPYTFPFPVTSADSVVVTLPDSSVLSPAKYNVVLTGEPPIYSNGALTLLVPTDPPQGSTITISRVTSVTQNMDYTAYGPFPAESHEAALDKLTMIAQETDVTGGGGGAQFHNDLLGRAVANAHPTSAIIGLDVDQAQQDQNLQDHLNDFVNPHQVNHAQLANVLPDDHHNQVHLFFGPDHSDIDPNVLSLTKNYSLVYDGQYWTPEQRNRVFFQTAMPTVDESSPGDLWFVSGFQ